MARKGPSPQTTLKRKWVLDTKLLHIVLKKLEFRNSTGEKELVVFTASHQAERTLGAEPTAVTSDQCPAAQRSSLPVPACGAASVIKTFPCSEKGPPVLSASVVSSPRHQLQLILAPGAEAPQAGLAGRALRAGTLYSFAKSRGSRI